MKSSTKKAKDALRAGENALPEEAALEATLVEQGMGHHRVRWTTRWMFWIKFQETKRG